MATITGTEGDDDIWGGGEDDTLLGGAGNDTLTGWHGNDLLEGGLGNDRLEQGDQGNDTLLGGDDNDMLFLFSTSGHGPQALEVHGGDGDDEFWVGTVVSDSGSILASGGAGQDTYLLLHGDSGRGLTITDFEVGVGGDSIEVEWLLPYIKYEMWWVSHRRGSGDYDGGNPFAAKQGFFRLVQEGAHTLLQFDPDGAAGAAHEWHTAAVLQNVDANTLTADNFGGIAPDGSPIAGEELVGTELGDQLQGWLGDDTLRGGLGDDSLSGAAGADLLDGADGEDILKGERGADTLLGGAGDDQLHGEAGDDLLHGGGGSDVLYGSGTSNDTLIGGIGHDVFYLFLHGGSDPQAVRASGGAGNDDFVIAAETGGSTALLTGGAGRDTYHLQAWPTLAMPHAITVTDFAIGAVGDLLDLGLVATGNAFAASSGYLRFVQSGADTLLQHDADGASGTASGWQTVFRFKGIAPSDITDASFTSVTHSGTGHFDHLLGGPGRDTLSGDAGNDTLDGGWGVDSMVGGTGYDTYVVHDTGDVVVELANEGMDTVRASVDWELGANFENLVLETGAVGGTGNAAANEITGNEAANLLDGGEGRDTLAGGAGDDEYCVDDLADRVIELAGAGIDLVVSSARTYALSANVENGTIEGDRAAILIGNARANLLQGGGGSNRLEGGAGADSLVGGGGRDVLTGGTGSDLFVFEAASDTGVNALARDRISDFVAGIGGDRIDLSGIDAKAGTAADNAFTFIGNSAFHGTNASGQLRYEYDSVKGVGILYGSTDADSAAEFSIELTGVASLAAADLIL